ncbi:DNA-(apurinic or apyrimidinic site) lyase [Hanseniaspora osmophila]
MKKTFERSATSKFKFGAHVSGSGGISNSVINAFNIGCNAFAMFLKSPRKWTAADYTAEEITKFHNNCKEHHYDPKTDILPHGQYMINLANPELDKAEKSYESFLDELKRCEQLNIGHYNFHPGSSLKGNHNKQLEQLASYINKAHKETTFVKIVLENMAGTGNLVGSDLHDLKTVIEMVHDKSRVGVCIDTCHAFAAGYDMVGNYDKFWQDFEKIIGFDYLFGIHLNDSKAPLKANRDLHEQLGQGFLGLKFFEKIAHSQFLHDVPIILETPHKDEEGYGEEIKILEWLETLDESSAPDNEQVIEKSKTLQKLGEPSRKKQQQAFEQKKLKSEKPSKKRKLSAKDGQDIMSKLTKKSKA